MTTERPAPGLDTLAAAIATRQRFVLTTHVQPDGDGLGSEIALWDGLQELGKSAVVLNDEPTPGEYAFLDGRGVLQRYSRRRHAQTLAEADMVILLDAGSPSRVGRLGDDLRRFGGTTAVIDHHVGVAWGEVRMVDPASCSTTTLVYPLLKRLGVQFSARIAEALYVGILTDTRGFRNANTTPDCLLAAGELAGLGADPHNAWRSLFARWPVGRLRLEGEFLASLRTSLGGRLVWSVIDRRLLTSHRQRESAVDGFVERALDARDAEMAVLFVEKTALTTRVSFRSREPVAVDALARSLGGGGHRLAAGTVLEGERSRVVRFVLRRAKELLTPPGDVRAY